MTSIIGGEDMSENGKKREGIAGGQKETDWAKKNGVITEPRGMFKVLGM